MILCLQYKDVAKPWYQANAKHHGQKLFSLFGVAIDILT